MGNIETNIPTVDIDTSQLENANQSVPESAAIDYVDNLNTQPENIDRQKIYSQTHGDGKIHSGNIEKIATVCDGVRGLRLETIDKMIKTSERAKAMRAAEKEHAVPKEMSKAEPKINTKNTINEKVADRSRQLRPLRRTDAIPLAELTPRAYSEVLPPAIVEQVAQIMAAVVRLEQKSKPEIPQKIGPDVAVKEIPKPPIVASKIRPQPRQTVRLAKPVFRPINPSKAAEVTIIKPFAVTAEKKAAAKPTQTILLTQEFKPPVELQKKTVGLKVFYNNVEQAPLGGTELDEVYLEPSILTEPLDSVTLPLFEAIEATESLVALEPSTILSMSESNIAEPAELLLKQPASAEQEPMIAQTQGFFEQVAPLVSEKIVDALIELPPEAVAEIVSQIELLVVVADRLHDLVVDGKQAGEEALQIEVFLSEKYQQLLRTVGVEPTPEMITQFIRYIYSDAYNLELAMSPIEIEDEGTHEKKLFDEASVFDKAQQAASALRQNLQTMLGRITVTNVAA